MDPLEAISPIDGRYFSKTKGLIAYFSELAIFKYRILVEVRYLTALSEAKIIRRFSLQEKKLLTGIFADFNLKEGQKIKEIEKVTHHDIKAVEYYLKEKVSRTSLKDVQEMIHFGLTSDDINNLAYGLALRDSLEQQIKPALNKLIGELKEMAFKNINLVMLARTHGQLAVPTTLGKEIAVFAKRLKEEYKNLEKGCIRGKLNGNVGNFNAHQAVFPQINWLKFSKEFVTSLGLVWEPLTTQILPYDSYVAIFDCLIRINHILIGLTQDFWFYISQGFFQQKVIKTEVGSSALPHKINPISFENAEGTLGLANSLLRFFSDKLLISRMQRDLSDSSVRRTIGEALVFCLLSYQSLGEGLSRVEADSEKLKEDLLGHWEIVAEGIQSVLRFDGYQKPYEALKNLSRGKVLAQKDMEKFIADLKVNEKTKEKLKKVTPLNYLGLTKKLTEISLKEI